MDIETFNSRDEMSIIYHENNRTWTWCNFPLPFPPSAIHVNVMITDEKKRLVVWFGFGENITLWTEYALLFTQWMWCCCWFCWVGRSHWNDLLVQAWSNALETYCGYFYKTYTNIYEDHYDFQRTQLCFMYHYGIIVFTLNWLLNLMSIIPLPWCYSYFIQHQRPKLKAATAPLAPKQFLIHNKSTIWPDHSMLLTGVVNNSYH